MASTWYSGFDLNRIGSMTAVIDTFAVTGVTITVPVATYSHVALNSVLGTGKYVAFAAAVETALIAGDPAGDLTCTYNATTRQYTIANAGDNWEMDFTSASGQRLAKAMGYTAANVAATSGSGYACKLDGGVGGLNFVSDVLPYYAVPLARGAPMHYSRPFKQAGMVHRATSVNGNGYVVKPITLESRIKLTLPWMPLANVESASALAAEPFTVEDLIDQASGIDPTLLVFENSGEHLIVKLVDDSMAYTESVRENAHQAGDFHAHWHIPLSLQLLGRL